MGFFSSPFLASPNPTPLPKPGPTRRSTVKISKPYFADSPPASPLSRSAPVADSQFAKASYTQPTFASTMFAGNNYWGSSSQPLLPLDVAKRNESVVKRGFEFSHNKSQEYRLSSAINVGRDGVVRCGDRKIKGSNATAAASAFRDIKYDPRADSSTKKILPRAPLVSLEDANRREKMRRRKAAQEVMARKIAQERHAQQLEREESLKKEQARLEELERVALESRRKEDLQMRQEAAALASAAFTPIIAPYKDHLVVGPTNWIVPLISLDDAKKNEMARRLNETVDGVTQANTQAAVITSTDHLVINTAKGSAELRLVSLEEARQRERIRRQREEALEAVESHKLMTAGAGTGLAHVPLVTLEEARRRESVKRRKGKNGKPTRVVHYRPFYQDDSESESDEEMGYRNAAGAQEKERWHDLMSRTNSWWLKPSGGSSFGCMDPGTKYPDWF